MTNARSKMFIIPVETHELLLTHTLGHDGFDCSTKHIGSSAVNLSKVKNYPILVSNYYQALRRRDFPIH